MSLITLKEFRECTRISDSSLIELLENNMLTCSIDPKEGIMFDVDSVGIQDLVEAIAAQKATRFDKEKRLLAEKAGRIIRENFEQIADQAVSDLLARKAS